MKRQELELEIKEIIVSALDLEDVTAADIVTDDALFGDGLGLDSIDALELGMALKKRYGVVFSADKEANKAYFKSVATLADYIAKSTGMNLE
ncbi:MAG: acyl carrier protein [Alphaproteobacteria bacterium]|nr:acyl carrier protein [Alphaproteobacteria bacterium]